MLRAAALCALLCALITPAFAQTAEDRAGELKAWREQCSDPDPDLRLAYLEAALASEDASITRICVRQSLESDNADIRNLGLRAALASIDQLTFAVTIPPQLDKAIKDAKGDERKLKEVYDWYVYRNWSALQGGLVVAIGEANIESATSKWFPLVNRQTASDNYSGKATVIGDEVSWVGGASLTRGDCRLILSLQPGPALAGILKCNDLWEFPVAAKLL